MERANTAELDDKLRELMLSNNFFEQIINLSGQDLLLLSIDELICRIDFWKNNIQARFDKLVDDFVQQNTTKKGFKPSDKSLAELSAHIDLAETKIKRALGLYLGKKYLLSMKIDVGDIQHILDEQIRASNYQKRILTGDIFKIGKMGMRAYGRFPLVDLDDEDFITVYLDQEIHNVDMFCQKLQAVLQTSFLSARTQYMDEMSLSKHIYNMRLYMLCLKILQKQFEPLEQKDEFDAIQAVLVQFAEGIDKLSSLAQQQTATQIQEVLES